MATSQSALRREHHGAAPHWSARTLSRHRARSTLSLNEVLYGPIANYHGPDSFTFQARDASLGSNVAALRLTLEDQNDPPRITSTVIISAGYALSYRLPAVAAGMAISGTGAN